MNLFPHKAFLAALFLLLFLAACAEHSREQPAMAQVSYAGKVNAPDFPSGLQWLNTDHPLSLKEFRGKVVLLDFWTFCCINCMHVIPDLKKLEAKYRDELVVIGVHSAKFTTEQGTENIRAAILRYGLEHPVVNDKDFQIWNAYGANAWPTFMLIDPEGKVVGRHSGEGIYDIFDSVIGGIIKEFDAQGKIDRRPVRFALEKDRAPETLLSFPGKIATNADGSLVYVTDSNHNRVLVISLPDDSIREVIGSGERGFKDGSFTQAQFNKPQGVTVDGNNLYIADTENHAIRKVDLATKTVTTLAGTGKQAQEFNQSGKGTAVALNSPWDLIARGNQLYIAMAGSHQIWTLDLGSGEVRPFAGSGNENIIDGALRDAALAQPSGITADGSELYIADSEVSGVREIDLGTNGKVRTIIGKGLFDYGDIDGTGATVRLQHPIGITYHDGALYVADTYNNKVKKIDPAAGRSETFIGTGTRGMKDGPAHEAELNEPNGLVFASGKLYITDTNNHLIRVYDPTTGMVSTLLLKNLAMTMPERTKEEGVFTGQTIQLKEQEAGKGTGELEINVRLPKGYEFNKDAPFFVGVRSDGNVVKVATSERTITNPSFPLRIPATFAAGSDTVTVDLVVYYCEAERESLCLVKQLRLKAPVRVAQTGVPARLDLDVAVQ